MLNVFPVSIIIWTYYLIVSLSLYLSFSGIIASYADQPDFIDHKSEIFNSLAAKALEDFSECTSSSSDYKREECSQKIVSFLKKTEDIGKMNEYTWLIKGFYEIRRGDLKRAAENFKFVLDRANKGSSERRKFLYGSLTGMVTPALIYNTSSCHAYDCF